MNETYEAEDDRRASVQRTGGAESREQRSDLWAAEARGGNAAPHQPALRAGKVRKFFPKQGGTAV